MIAKKETIGVDVFLCWDEAERDPGALAARLESVDSSTMRLRLITNRGVKVYPDGAPETFCTDHWRCRFRSDSDCVQYSEILDLLRSISGAGLDVIKTENLCTFDGVPGFSMGQGE